MLRRPFIPPMQHVPAGATDAQRDEMYRAYLRELVNYNMHLFLPPAVKKRWWHLGMIEYPAALIENRGGTP